MSNNVYLGNLPEWVTADDIKSWLDSSELVCDSIRVIRDFETQESKGYAFVEAPNEEEMHAIIRRFHRAPIEGKLLRAKEAHPKGDAKAAAPRPARRRRRRRDVPGGADGVPDSGGRGRGKEEQVGSLGEALQKAL